MSALIRTASFVLLAFFILGLPAVLYSQSSQRIKIGISTTLSGEAATYGTDIKNVLLFANKKLGRGRFQLIIEDDKCNGRDAVSVAQKFVAIDKVKYVLGYGCSGALLAAAPVLEKAGIVTIGAATAAPAISQAGEYIFRTFPSDLSSAQVLLPYIAARQQTLGIISEETEFAQGLYRAISELNAVSPGGLKILNENYLPGASDFRAILLKLKDKQAGGLLINTQTEGGFVLIYRQLLELGWRPAVYANYQPNTPLFLETFGKRADGIVFADTPFIDQIANARGLELYREFVSEYGELNWQPFLFITAYAAFAVLEEAVSSGADVKDYLYNHTFSSVVDNLSFDRNGDPIGLSNVLKTLSGGKPMPLNN